MKKSISIGSDCAGVGAFTQALKRLEIDYIESFACDFDFFARQTYLLNFGTKEDIELSNSKEHKKYADGVKRIALSSEKPTIEENTFLLEANEFAKKFSFYYPFNMYQREIPQEPCDIYISSVPCQAFSLAGKRLGKEDKRGILFFNSLEFIQENKPRYFIFENVKGLLSHDKQDKNAEYGRTFQEWINYLGGKSVNGVYTFFPIEDSVPYHIYFQVLNAKHYGIPQNRERIFIIGIRDDEDNNFHFPKPFPLEKRLKDILETEVDEKYFLSDKMVKVLAHHQNRIVENENPNESGCIHAGYFKMGGRDQQYVKDELNQVASLYENNADAGRIYDTNSVSCTLKSDGGGGGAKTGLYLVENKLSISTNNSKGFDEAEEEEDSINFSVPSSTTRRGRVGKKVSQTLDTQCNQGIVTKQLSKQEIEKLEKDKSIIYDLTNDFGEQTREYTEYAPSLRSSRNGLATNVEYTGVAVHPNSKKLEFNGFKDENCPTLLATDYKAPKCIQYNTQRIRRLTPLECFRLMDFNEDFVWNVSDSQAYKQAGNSICVGVLAAIISKLKL